MFQSLGFSTPGPGMTTTSTSVINSRQWRFRRNSISSSTSNVVTNLFRREVHGTSLHKLNNPFGDIGTPSRLRMPVEDIIPGSALEAGNIFMGFTNCGRYLLSYTCRPAENFGASVFDTDGSYVYTLHMWLFTPFKRIRKVSQVCLFDNNGVYDNNLLIEMSQWNMDDSHLLVTGYSENPDSECHHIFYTTIITIPEAKNCPNCVYMHDEELEDVIDVAVDARMRTNCIRHGLTLHMKYDHVAPYPKLNADVQLRFKDTVLLNTGNLIHMVSFRLIHPSPVKSDVVVVPASTMTISTVKIPMRCDLWLRIANANIGALSSTSAYEAACAAEENIISLNALDALLSWFPDSACSRQLVQGDICKVDRTRRRFSQSSTDSDFSIFSPKSIGGCDYGPLSPPFLNKPKSPRRCESSDNGQEKDTMTSPSKLMLPPQERKFFKRRLSSQSLTSNTNASNTVVSPTKPQVEEPTTTSSISPTTPTQSQENDKSAFDVFEMRFEDTSVERHLSSFKTFRKRRLADKKYEFNDADLSAENIIPLKMTRRKSKYASSQGTTSNCSNPRSPRNENENTTGGGESPRGPFIDHPRSPRAHHIMSPIMSPNHVHDSLVSDVLRPLNNNFKVKVSTPSPNNISSMDLNDVGKFKQEDMSVGKDYSSQLLTQGSKKIEHLEIPNHPNSKPTVSIHVNCIAKVLRSYIQKDDDNMSVITDIEDELGHGYPFPVALPLDVHGAGYQQLQMISNSKAEKFQVPVVQVLQRTLDIEMLCNEVANLICLASDKHYCSCIDFDLTFADANPDRGTVTTVIVMLVQATSAKPRNRGEKANMPPSVYTRKKYETFFTCEWVPSGEHCRILYKGNLQELETIPDPWHPTKNMETIIKAQFHVLKTSKKTLSNALAVHDWQSLDELVDASGIVTIFKDEGPTQKTDRRLNYLNNSIFEPHVDLASIPSTATDSDDEWGM